VVKNKVSPPFKIAEFDIMYGEGISRESSVIDLGVENGIVKKSGSWFTYNGDQLGQGKEKARMFLKENPDLADEIERLIFEKLGIGEFAVKPGEEDQDMAVPGVADDLSDDPVDMVPNVDFDDEDDE
ncbi:MAG: DNA recombination/repair protein RecA, partial [Planctomycetes bacterium]|nr:DNA recombination/repair protein RecA [Planctomycetota bacterium]